MLICEPDLLCEVYLASGAPERKMACFPKVLGYCTQPKETGHAIYLKREPQPWCPDWGAGSQGVASRTECTVCMT